MIPMSDDPIPAKGSVYPIEATYFAQQKGLDPNMECVCPRCEAKFSLHYGRAYPSKYQYKGKNMYGIVVFCSLACVILFLDESEAAHA